MFILTPSASSSPASSGKGIVPAPEAVPGPRMSSAVDRGDPKSSFSAVLSEQLPDHEKAFVPQATDSLARPDMDGTARERSLADPALPLDLAARRFLEPADPVNASFTSGGDIGQTMPADPDALLMSPTPGARIDARPADDAGSRTMPERDQDRLPRATRTPAAMSSPPSPGTPIGDAAPRGTEDRTIAAIAVNQDDADAHDREPDPGTSQIMGRGAPSVRRLPAVSHALATRSASRDPADNDAHPVKADLSLEPAPPAAVGSAPLLQPHPADATVARRDARSASDTRDSDRVGRGGAHARSDGPRQISDGSAGGLMTKAAHGSQPEQNGSGWGAEPALLPEPAPTGDAIRPELLVATPPVGVPQPVPTTDIAPAVALPGAGTAFPFLPTTGTDAAPSVPASRQIEPMLLSFGQSPNGNSSMSLELAPEKLGRVSVTLDRAVGGRVSITVGATDPTTLRELEADHAHLHALLDQAAVPKHDRQLGFELIPVSPVVQEPPATPPASGNGDSGTAPASGGGGGNGSGDGRGAAHDRQDGQTSRFPGSGAGQDAAPAIIASSVQRWRFAGIDITA
ncbi:flagellar hook-length control protein FliK [Rhizosaccharibacter radicis]|uniref:Flagellar hook-length control protein FliK n=1 Tax=Rhizosaccharibacter radicis TaxID=2782605 RepID=A0ABT1VTG5_9PROT|nr:flagellar hook-length control protein FliK [Acetobacteraceae bacterium KSS12]